MVVDKAGCSLVHRTDNVLIYRSSNAAKINPRNSIRYPPPRNFFFYPVEIFKKFESIIKNRFGGM